MKNTNKVYYLKFEIFKVVTVKNVFWDVAPCGCCKNRRFGETYLLHHECSMLRLLVTANVVPSSLIISTLMMEAIRSSETSVLTRTTRRHIPQDGILQALSSIQIRSNVSYFNSNWLTTKKCSMGWKGLQFILANRQTNRTSVNSLSFFVVCLTLNWDQCLVFICQDRQLIQWILF
jgi:hypothetical protein